MYGEDPRARRVPPRGGPGAPDARRPPPPHRNQPPPHRGQPPPHRDQPPPRRDRPHIEPTQVVRRGGAKERPPLAWSQAPEAPPDRSRRAPGPRRTGHPGPRGREPRQAHAPTQRPVPYRDTTHAPTQRPVPFRDNRRKPPAPPGPPARSRRAPRPPHPRRKRHLGRWFLVLLVVLILGLITAVIRLDGSLSRIDALSDYSDRIADTPGTNWLLVGSDSRAGLTADQETGLATGGDVGSARTDTVILVHIPPSGRTTLVSLPRDSYVGVPGHGKDKLNASFAIGGPQLLVQTVEIATGLRIDHYAQIGFAGFADVVDSLGGIDVCVPQAINDPLAGIDLPAGCQELNGPEALGFVRSRATALADIDRMNNQRLFLSALLQKATSASTLANPFRLWPMTGDVARSLTVDEGDHIWDLARLAWALRGDTLATSVPLGGFTDTASGNVLLWAKPDASRFFEALAEGRPVPADLQGE
nr:LCP family protein [Nocardia donostiensis]